MHQDQIEPAKSNEQPDNTSLEAVCNLLSAESILCELKEFQLNMELQQHAMARLMISVCGHLQELCQDILERNNELENSLKTFRRLEREAIKIQLPLWFWRFEKNKRLKPQLNQRARFLINQVKACDDDVFDLLREFIDDWVRPEEHISDDEIVGLMKSIIIKGK